MEISLLRSQTDSLLSAWAISYNAVCCTECCICMWAICGWLYQENKLGIVSWSLHVKMSPHTALFLGSPRGSVFEKEKGMCAFEAAPYLAQNHIFSYSSPFSLALICSLYHCLKSSCLFRTIESFASSGTHLAIDLSQLTPSQPNYFQFSYFRDSDWIHCWIWSNIKLILCHLYLGADIWILILR